MNNMKLLLGVMIVLGASTLAGCDDDVPQQTQYVPAPQQQMVDEQYVNQPAPQAVQAAPAPVIVQGGHDSGIGDFATGMILGHVMSGGSNNSSRATIINNNTVSQPRSSYSSNSRSSSYSTNKQIYQTAPRAQTQSRPTMNTNSAYSAKKSYSSPMSSYSKPSRSYSSKSFSSSRSSFSSSRRR